LISPDFGGYSHFIQSRTNERRIIDFVELGIADIQSLGRYEYHVVRPGLSNHSHLGAVEISYLKIRLGNRKIAALFTGSSFACLRRVAHS